MDSQIDGHYEIYVSPVGEGKGRYNYKTGEQEMIFTI